MNCKFSFQSINRRQFTSQRRRQRTTALPEDFIFGAQRLVFAFQLVEVMRRDRSSICPLDRRIFPNPVIDRTLADTEFFTQNRYRKAFFIEIDTFFDIWIIHFSLIVSSCFCQFCQKNGNSDLFSHDLGIYYTTDHGGFYDFTIWF